MLTFQGELTGEDGNPVSLRDDIPELVSKDRRRLAVELGRLLRGPKSLWPRDTGRSGNAFYVQVRAGGRLVILNRRKNPRTGEVYAPFVEAGYPAPRTRNSIRRTIAAGWEGIFERINSADP